jgi:hypothetical protein
MLIIEALATYAKQGIDLASNDATKKYIAMNIGDPPTIKYSKKHMTGIIGPTIINHERYLPHLGGLIEFIIAP